MNAIEKVKKLLEEFELEKNKMAQLQVRMDQVEQLLSTEFACEQTKVKQNQKRLDDIEGIIVQNQQRLDNIEGIIVQNQQRLEGTERTIVQNQQRLDAGETIMTQNQQRLDAIENLLTVEYANEKLKIAQNQMRLDNLEKLSRLQGRELELLFSAADSEHKSIKKFNFLDKTTNSQSGEDAILAYAVSRLHIPLEECTYLDLGANRPIEGSNTHFFYTRGATGVLVEANPELIPALEEQRKGDIILNKCIGTTDGEKIEFIIMSDDGLSTTDEEEVLEIQKINPDIKVKSRVEVESITVNTIMETYFSEAPVICSIDVEGMDLDILHSIDFEKYRPCLIVVEMIEYSNELAICDKNKNILEYMKSVGYEEYAFTGINSIFIDVLTLKKKWNYNI